MSEPCNECEHTGGMECPECDGTGLDHEDENCAACGGSGSSECPHCNGDGFLED